MIYKSGAGSGKTYTLTREYLKLALKSESPHAYKRILAVTFTKKAAREMKSRILEWLREISESESPEENDKVKEILNAVGVSALALQRRAELMHEHILHHYSDFSVQTIDSFVHRIIKSFSRDLKLSTDFEVEMDVEKVITEVVSDQLREMGENQNLSDTLQNFLAFQLEEEKSTRLKTELVSFFQNNTDEKATASLGRLSAKSFEDFKQVRNAIDQRAKQLKKEILQRQEQLVSKSNPLLDDVTTHLRNWIIQDNFDKLVDYGKTPLTCLKKENIFTGKKLSSSSDHQHVNDEVLGLMSELIPLLDEYSVVSKLVKNCYLLALIQDYKKRFEVYKQENNTILISDFTQIIQNVVKDNPAPFIYERLGERYKYYLIDEFQDTSLTQWQNFLPLISHTLANGNMAMIVGDSKQAIYRWRNGDFKLFATLPEMTYEPDDFLSKESEAQLKRAAQVENLSRNFRSSSEVVEFNNAFFKGFDSELSATGKAMYAGMQQTPVIDKSDGYVEVQLFGKKSDEDENEKFLARILGIIQQAERRNFDLGDIAILTRKNKKLAEIATFLNQHNVQTSSQEGLLLKNNLKVRLAMGLLQAVAFPQDDSNNTQLFTLLEIWGENEPDLLLHPSFLDLYTTPQKRTHSKIKIWEYLKGLMGKVDVEAWSRLSAFDALQRIIAYLKLNEQPDDYLETLLDVTFHAARRGHNSIKEFIEYWQDNEKLSLSTAEDKHSVKLMTVHKSKGLEFPVVIYAEPFSQGMPGQIWYDLDGLDTPLEYALYKDGGFFSERNKKHQALDEKYSLIKATAEHEASEKFLDGLNILYVALTRASQNLFVIGLDANDKLKTPTLEVFKNVFGHDLDSEVFTSGKLTNKSVRKVELVEEVETISGSLKTYDWKKRLAFRFSNQPLNEDSDSLTERQLGIAIHKMLSEIKITDSWGATLEELKEHLADEELMSGLKKLSTNEEWKRWFNEPLKVFNERHLIDSEGNEYIPDRVMEFTNEVVVVDYKTGVPDVKHADQVSNYVSLLSELFTQPVSGRLVYLREGRIVEV